MGENSRIAWTDHTFNPWIGCTKVSPGCDACYAEAFDKRMHGGKHWGPDAPRQRTSDDNWRKPDKWNRDCEWTGKRARVFCASLADVFDNEVPNPWRWMLWKVVKRTTNLRWMILTKRIGNAIDMLPPDWDVGYENVMLMATVVNQPEADRDLGKLRDIPARWKGISIEPQLGPVELFYLCDDADALRGPGIKISGAMTESTPNEAPEGVDTSDSFLDLVITGGESRQSGHEPRDYDIGWARSIIEQCKVASVACFVKQLGASPIINGAVPRLYYRTIANSDPDGWPEDLRVQQMPEGWM